MNTKKESRKYIMLKKINKINFKNVNFITFITLFSTALVQGISFLTLPIFTRLLGTSQYGIYSLFSSYVSIFTCFLGLSMSSAIGTGMYEFKKEYINFRNSNLVCTTLISIIQILIIIIFRNLISKIINLDSIIIIFICIAAFGHYIMMYCQLALTYEKRATLNFVVSLLYSILSVAISLLLIIKLPNNERYIGRILGVTISYVVSSALIWFIFFNEKRIGISRKFTKFGLRIGIPIIFHSLSLNILIQSDRVMMQYYGIGMDFIGIYSTFYTLCTILTILSSSLNNSWTPFYYDDLTEKKYVEINNKSKNYIELFTILCLGFLLLSREISYIITDKSYWAGINVIPFLVISSYFIYLYQFPVNYEFFYKKTKYIAFGTIIAAIINIILNKFLISKFGMYGAAVATSISYMLLFIAHYIIVSNIKENKYHLRFKTFIPSILSIFIGVLAFYLLKDLWIIRWGLGFIIGGYELYKIYKRKSIF